MLSVLQKQHKDQDFDRMTLIRPTSNTFSKVDIGIPS